MSHFGGSRPGILKLLAKKIFCRLVLYFHSSWDNFRCVGRLKAEGRGVWSGGERLNEVFKEEWQRIKNTKLEKKRFEREAERKRLESEAEEKHLEKKRDEEKMRLKMEAEKKQL